MVGLSRTIKAGDLSEEDIQVLNATYDYLSEEDIPEKSDLIFVFGSKTPLRIDKAVELYNQGVSEIIQSVGQCYLEHLR